jgi:hypothetical protein
MNSVYCREVPGKDKAGVLSRREGTLGRQHNKAPAHVCCSLALLTKGC